MKRWLIAAALAAFALGASAQTAQTYPNKPIRFVVS